MESKKSVTVVMDELVAAGLKDTVDGLVTFSGNLHHQVAPAVTTVAEANDWLDGDGELTQEVADSIRSWAVTRGWTVGRS